MKRYVAKLLLLISLGTIFFVYSTSGLYAQFLEGCPYETDDMHYVHADASPSKIVATLWEMSRENRNVCETAVLSTCYNESCHTVSAKGMLSAIPTEVNWILAERLLKNAVIDKKIILFQTHNHTIGDANRSNRSRKERRTRKAVPRPDVYISGPSSDADCATDIDKPLRAYKLLLLVRVVSLVVEPGGFWVCVASQYRGGFDSRYIKKMMDARDRLRHASQFFDGDVLRGAVMKFEHDVARIYPGLRVKFMRHGSTDEEIFAAARKILDK